MFLYYIRYSEKAQGPSRLCLSYYHRVLMLQQMKDPRLIAHSSSLYCLSVVIAFIIDDAVLLARCTVVGYDR